MNKYTPVLFLLTIFVSAVLLSTPISAIRPSRQQRYEWAQNNIIFFTPCNTEEDCNSDTSNDPDNPSDPDDPNSPQTINPGSNNTVTTELNGVTFNMINSKILPTEYTNKACRKYQICQSADPSWSNKCDAFARTNAADVYYGQYTPTLPNYHAGKFTVNKSFSDSSPAGLQAALSFIYDQIMAGKPVVLAANLCRYKHSDSECRSSRHFITIVGVSQTASRDTVSERDLLYIDPWGSTLAHTGQNNARRMRFDTSNHAWYMYIPK